MVLNYHNNFRVISFTTANGLSKLMRSMLYQLCGTHNHSVQIHLITFKIRQILSTVCMLGGHPVSSDINRGVDEWAEE